MVEDIELRELKYFEGSRHFVDTRDSSTMDWLEEHSALTANICCNRKLDEESDSFDHPLAVSIYAGCHRPALVYPTDHGKVGAPLSFSSHLR